MRTATYPVFVNIKLLVSEIICPCCGAHEDTMSHQLECQVINKNMLALPKNAGSIDYIFFQDLSKQVKVTRIFDEATKRRKQIIKNKQQ